MKNLILILSIFIFGSCVNANCPCIVKKVVEFDNHDYNVTFKSSTGSNEFIIYTTHKYSIGDTLK